VKFLIDVYITVKKYFLTALINPVFIFLYFKHLFISCFFFHFFFLFCSCFCCCFLHLNALSLLKYHEITTFTMYENKLLMNYLLK
jgi:hypothetical protein